VSGFITRQERFEDVGSTNDVVRGWLLDGTPEVCIAIADEQTAGRGRDGRTWAAPAGAGLLLSVGFRPDWLAPEHAWRLAALVSLAMAEAADGVVGASNTLHLKWPNDLVVVRDGAVRKVAGVLGETAGFGTSRPTAVIGIGVNANWEVADFPPELAGSMTSLAVVAGRSVDQDLLLDVFLGRLESMVQTTRFGGFDELDWAARQVTTGRVIDLVAPDGTATTVRAVGVDTATGALLVVDPARTDGVRSVMVGEIQHVRLAEPIVAGV
jgi:BirA family biotin operon repressor/biotin-[acetyl-CoA-carboxylase] ligase